VTDVLTVTSPHRGSAGAGRDRESALLARMNRLPGWPLPKFDFVVLGVAYFFVFYDIADIGFGMPAIVTQWHLSTATTKFVAVAIGLIGYIVGSIAIGWMSDRTGRRTALVAALLISAVGSLGCAFAWDVVSLSAWRFVTGMGVGAALNLASTYLDEISPPGRRGRYSVATFMVGIIGQAVTPFIALGLVPHFTIGWRLLFGIGAIVGLFGVLSGFRLPESPRWLAEHGQFDDAEQLIEEMESRFDPSELASVEEPDRDGSHDSHDSRDDLEPERREGSWGDFLHSRHGVTALTMAAMWFLWYIGNYGFLGDSATLFSENGMSIGSSTLYLAIGAIGYPVGAGIMLLTSDRFERKYLILINTLVWLAGMVMIATLADKAVVTAGSFLASVALGSYLQVAYAYTAESFPTRLRARGFSLADGVGHGGGAVGALLLPTLIAGTTFFTGFLVIGITGALAGVIALAGPKVSGRSLEQVTAG
jgi:MFS family permease